MKVSVVIPCYNSEEYIEETLKSLVEQTYKNFEVVISDGGSDDNTLMLIKQYSDFLDIKLRSSNDKGMYDAINQGFSMASGDIYCYLNSDDIYEDYTLEHVVEIFEKHNEIEFVYGNMYMFGEKKKKIFYPILIKLFFKNVNYSMFGQPSTFWKSSLYNKVGGFNDELKMAGDYDYFCKCLDYPIYRTNRFLSSFRYHDASLTSNNSDLSVKEMELIRRYRFGINNQSKIIYFFSDMYFKFFNLVGKLLKNN